MKKLAVLTVYLMFICLPFLAEHSLAASCIKAHSQKPDSFPKLLETLNYPHQASQKFSERWGFITGATSGIGLHTAYLLASEGSNLYLNGRRSDRLDAVKKDLEARFGVEVITLDFDVADNGKWNQVIAEHGPGLQKVSMVIANAGSANGLDPVGNINHENTMKMINTNVIGTTLTLNHLVPVLKKYAENKSSSDPEPTLITLGSIVGKMPSANNAVYSATKSFIHTITDALRIELNSRGVRVSLIVPGMVSGTEFSLVRADGDIQKAQAIYQGVTPLSPADIAVGITTVLALPNGVSIPEVQLNPSAQANTYNTYRIPPPAAAEPKK